MPETYTRRELLTARSNRKLVFSDEAQRVGDVFILIFLRGGMDGLHVVPPFGDSDYYNARPNLRVNAPDGRGQIRGVDLDGFFGLHPNAEPLKKHFDAGRLAIVHASGSPDASRSHFEAMQTMERGVADGNTIASGWLARHLNDFSTGNTSPMRAIAIGDVLPKSLGGALQATAVRTIGEFRLDDSLVWSSAFRATLTSLYDRAEGPIAEAGRDTMELLKKLDKLSPETYQPENGAVYPERSQNGLAGGLKEIAQLIKEGAGLEVAVLELGGWDAHHGQISVPFFDGLITQLSTAVDAFATDLGDHLDRVTLVAMSEFGRCVRENRSLGTDHGRATAMFILGGHIAGGKVYGEWPTLARDQLVEARDVRVTTDYRDILGEIVLKRIGNPALETVFPGYEPRFLGLTV